MVGVTDIVTEGSSEIILRTVFISCGFFSPSIDIANRSMRNKKGYLATLLSRRKSRIHLNYVDERDEGG